MEWPINVTGRCPTVCLPLQALEHASIVALRPSIRHLRCRKCGGQRPVSQDLSQAFPANPRALNAHEPQMLLQHADSFDNPMYACFCLHVLSSAFRNFSGCSHSGARPGIVQIRHGRYDPYWPGHGHGLSFGHCWSLNGSLSSGPIW